MNTDMNTDRWTDLKAFVTEWYRPIEPGDGCAEEEIVQAESQLGFRLPQALRELYLLVGRSEVVRGQDKLYLPEQLRIEDGYLWIWEENQCVALQAISEKDLPLENPPVPIQLDGEWDEESGHLTLTQRALQMVATEIMLNCGEHRWMGFAGNLFEPDKELMQEVVEQISLYPHPVLADAGFGLSNNVLILRGSGTFNIMGKSEEAVQSFMKQYNRIEWQNLSLLQFWICL